MSRSCSSLSPTVSTASLASANACFLTSPPGSARHLNSLRFIYVYVQERCLRIGQRRLFRLLRCLIHFLQRFRLHGLDLLPTRDSVLLEPRLVTDERILRRPLCNFLAAPIAAVVVVAGVRDEAIRLCLDERCAFAASRPVDRF